MEEWRSGESPTPSVPHPPSPPSPHLLTHLLATLLLAIVILKSAFLTRYETFLDFSPLISAIALALLSQGWSGIQHYAKPIAVLAFPAFLPALASRLIDLAPLTAKASTLMLLLGGVPVLNRGVDIFYQGSAVQVNEGCSGLSVILQLLNLVLIYSLMIPIQRWQGWILTIAAVAIAFFINSIRVALLAILHTSPTPVAFDYWHTGEGSVIFSLIAVLLLGAVFYFWMPRRAELRVKS